jgi:hypothetical protein
MQNLKRIIERNFYLGYNNRDKPEDLRNTKDGVVYMALVQNGLCDEGKIIKRDGYDQIGNVTFASKVWGQDRHEPYGGSKYILRAIDNGPNIQIEGWSGSGNFVALTGATTMTQNNEVNFAMANNATYIFNGVDTVLKTTNGTSATAVATIPVGKDGVWFHNYFFIFGVASNPDRLYFSNIGAPETFTALTGYLDINPGDNEPIIALSVLKDELLIIKPSRHWSLTGFGTTDFTLDDLGERGTNIGTRSHRSVVSVGNDVYYLSYRGSVPHFRSIRKTEDGQIVDGGLISDTITGTMKTLNLSQIEKVAGEFDGRRVWWAIPTGTATENNTVVVHDTSTKGWVVMTGINASVIHISSIAGTTDLYFGSSEADGKSHKLNSGKDDDGDAIDFVVKTPLYNPQPAYESRYKYLYVTGESSDADLDVYVSKDGFTEDYLTTISMVGLGAKFGYATFGYSKFGDTTIAKKRINYAGGNAYYMQYIFKNNAANEDITLREWDIFYYDKGLREI